MRTGSRGVASVRHVIWSARHVMWSARLVILPVALIGVYFSAFSTVSTRSRVRDIWRETEINGNIWHVNSTGLPQQTITRTIQANESRTIDVKSRMSASNKAAVLSVEDVTLYGNPKTNGTLVIGLSSVVRNGTNTTYLRQTLRSLDQNIHPDEHDQVTIFIYAADFNVEHRKSIISLVNETFPHYLESGFMVVMEVTASAYPTLKNLKRNYGDAPSRVYWRSKQVVDFAFMFSIGAQILKHKYYMQIEDDVTSAANLYERVMNGVAQNSNKSWTMLKYSTLGGIGTFYKTQDLEKLSAFLLLFYQEMPVDWLDDHFCKVMAQEPAIYIHPSLFQHFGRKSSFAEKTKFKSSNVLDKHFRYKDKR